jgi:hypothetical protein
MSKHRSPNCPQITFAEAIEKGRKVYDKEHTHPAAKQVVAGDLGYSGMNGRSLSLIGALRQYGILEGSGDALRVTKDAVAYFEMDDGPEKQQAIQNMLFAPALFAELWELSKDKLPSDGNLRHQLIGKGFLPKSADEVIATFRANLALAGKVESAYDEGEKEKPLMPPETLTPPAQQKPPLGGVQPYAFPLAPDVRAELTFRGPLAVEHLEVLRAQIDLTIQALGGKPRPTVETKQ